MKLLLCDPGASSSTADVFYGYRGALERAGHEVLPFHLSTRIDLWRDWHEYAWRKAGKPDPRPTWADTIYRAGVDVIERALRFQPDWVIVVSAMYMHPDALVMLKRSGAKVAYILTESPYDLEHELRVAPFADLVFTNERSVEPAFRAVNPLSYYLPAAYDPDRHNPDPMIGDDEVPAHDVVFVGTAFQERVELLNAIDWTGIDLGLYGNWDDLGSRSKLRQHVRGKVITNAIASALYRRAKVGLNLYRTSKGFGRNVPRVEHAESINPRGYELAACGVFQVSDYRRAVEQLFGPSVPMFRTPDELQGIIRLALTDDDWRRQCAVKSHERIRGNTFDARVKVLMDRIAACERVEAMV